jgi:hypothetical protein
MRRRSYFTLVVLSALVSACETKQAPYAPLGPPYLPDDGGTPEEDGGDDASPGGGRQLTQADFNVACEDLSPEDVYIQGSTTLDAFYWGDGVEVRGMQWLYNVDGSQSMPCMVACVELIAYDGQLLRTDDCGVNIVSPDGTDVSPDVSEAVLDFMTWSYLHKKWALPTGILANDYPVLRDDRVGHVFCDLLAFPDRPGALARCFMENSREQWWDTKDPTDFQVRIVRDRKLLALGRKGLMLFAPTGNANNPGDRIVVVANEAGEIGRAELPEGFEIADARASDDGFLIVVQMAGELEDVRQFFLSETGTLSEGETYPNPARVHVGGAVLRADGSFFVRQPGEKNEQVWRFDPGGSAPVVVLEETKSVASSADPFPLNQILGFVTGG